MTKPKSEGTVRLIEARRRWHGVNDKLVVTLLPDGTLKVREQGRRFSVLLDVTTLYVRTLIAQVKVKNPTAGGSAFFNRSIEAGFTRFLEQFARILHFS